MNRFNRTTFIPRSSATGMNTESGKGVGENSSFPRGGEQTKSLRPERVSKMKIPRQLAARNFILIDPPLNLEDVIFKRIIKERRKSALVRFTLLGGTSLVSLLGLVKAGTLLWQSFIQTGFYEYTTLIFSDGSALASYWKEFAFSLIESLPLISLISLLSITAIFIWSSTKALKDARVILFQT